MDNYKNYVGSKIIKAKLSNLKEYKILKWGENAKILDTDEVTECYIVMYPPICGGDIYYSMSPKQVFEACYREIDKSEIHILGV